MITITLEGGCWQDILDEMTIIQECARRASSAPRIEAKPEDANIAKDDRSCQDGPKTPSCPACGKQFNEFDYNEHKWFAMDRKEYYSVTCSIAGRNMAEQRATAPEEPKKPVCAYCGAELGHAADLGPYGQLFCSTHCVDAYMELIRNAALTRLGDVLGDYQLGPEERAEILERVR